MKNEVCYRTDFIFHFFFATCLIIKNGQDLKGKNETIVTNRKARHEYFIVEEVEAGIVLTGTEVKSLRSGKGSIQEAYCYVSDQEEALILGLHIPPYEQGNIFNHNPTRDRRLLLKKQQIRKIKRKLEEKGMTLVPLELFFNDRNLVKVTLGLAKGKKSFDKRESLKEKDIKREMDRAIKDF